MGEKPSVKGYAMISVFVYSKQFLDQFIFLGGSKNDDQSC